MMPTIMSADVLIRTTNSLTDAIAGIVPPPNMTTDAIKQFINIFKSQAMKAKDAATTQRVLKERAQAQRVITKANHQEDIKLPTTEPISNSTTQWLVEDTTYPPLEVQYPNLYIGTCHNTPIISQNEHLDTSSPAENTCLQRKVRTITQDYLFYMMDTPSLAQPFTNKQAADRKYPLQFLCDFTYAALNNDMGDLLKYRHLLKHPKYKDVWSKSFGKEIYHLATTTKTIAFMAKQQISQARCKDITYGCIMCVYCSEKKDPYRKHITMGGNLV